MQKKEKAYQLEKARQEFEKKMKEINEKNEQKREEQLNVSTEQMQEKRLIAIIRNFMLK